MKNKRRRAEQFKSLEEYKKRFYPRRTKIGILRENDPNVVAEDVSRDLLNKLRSLNLKIL